MAKAYFISNAGDESVLKLKNYKLPDPEPNEVSIRQTAVGVNHYDIHNRNGTYPLAEYPAIIGTEACGVITKLGSNVKNFKEGEKVIYGTGAQGAYATEQNIDAELILPMDPEIPDDIMLACFSKGLMAHCLSFQCYHATKLSTILVHGATGGIAHLLIQVLSLFEPKMIIGTVGSDEKMDLAKAVGCHHVINYTKSGFSSKVLELTDGQGVNAIFDSLGKAAFERNLKCISPFGLLINYGDVTGPLTSINVMDLWTKSLYFARPSLNLYKGFRVPMSVSASLVTEFVKKGKLKPRINKFNFNEIPQIHQMMRERKTQGCNIAVIG